VERRRLVVRAASGVISICCTAADEALAYWVIGSAPVVCVWPRSLLVPEHGRPGFAVVSFSPTIRNRISCLPLSESKCHAPFFETSGMGKGQFSGPIYSYRASVGFLNQTVHLLIISG